MPPVSDVPYTTAPATNYVVIEKTLTSSDFYCPSSYPFTTRPQIGPALPYFGSDVQLVLQIDSSVREMTSFERTAMHQALRKSVKVLARGRKA